MTAADRSPDSDPHLLAEARRILAEYGFRIRESRLPDPADAPWLLAENEYFLIALAAGQAFDDLKVFEGYLASALGELLEVSEIGAKRWDAYVVLLASADSSERGNPAVIDLEHNTRALRRLVSLGVSKATVEKALAPFLPLPGPPPGGLPSAYDQLIEELVVHGIESSVAARTVNVYRRSGDWDEL